MANVARADSPADAPRVVLPKSVEFGTRFAAPDLYSNSEVRDALAVVLKPGAPSSPGIRVAATSNGVAGRGGTSNGSTSSSPASSGPTGSTGRGVNGQDPTGSDDVADTVQQASEHAQAAAVACGVRDFHTNSICIADALDAYAAELEALAPSLPPRLQSLPGIVRAAASKVRTARTKKEAVSALASAQTQVNRAIALLRSDDPNSVRAGTQIGRDVNETLGVAQEALLRSSEL